MKNTELKGVEKLPALVTQEMLDSIQPGGFLVVRVKDADYNHDLAPSKYCDCWSACAHRRSKPAIKRLLKSRSKKSAKTKSFKVSDL
jgi:hypothetical protein